jgi:hypothetical protein
MVEAHNGITHIGAIAVGLTCFDGILDGILGGIIDGIIDGIIISLLNGFASAYFPNPVMR